MKPTVSLGGEGVPSSLSYSLYQNTLGDCQSFGMGLYKKPTHLQHGFCSVVVVLGFCLFWSACNSQRWGECPTACMWRSGYTVLEWHSLFVNRTLGSNSGYGIGGKLLHPLRHLCRAWWWVPLITAFGNQRQIELSLRTAWSTMPVPGQPGLLRHKDPIPYYSLSVCPSDLALAGHTCLLIYFF